MIILKVFWIRTQFLSIPYLNSNMIILKGALMVSAQLGLEPFKFQYDNT